MNWKQKIILIIGSILITLRAFDPILNIRYFNNPNDLWSVVEGKPPLVTTDVGATFFQILGIAVMTACLILLLNSTRPANRP